MLIIKLPKPQKIKIGKLGIIAFRKGCYIYVGSAPSYKGYYTPRIERHFRKKKKLFWDIDYLLKKAKIIDVKYSRLSECAAAKKLAKKYESVKGFGCSDCSCGSHLFHLKNFRAYLCSIAR